MMLLAQGSQYYGVTTVHPVGLTVVLILGFATVMLPRQWSVLPFILMACFIPSAQRIVVGSLDFNFIRILVLFGWIRVLARNEHSAFRWAAFDWILIAWAVSRTTAYTILHGEVSALIFQLGRSYDALGLYFFFRCVVRNIDDFQRIAVIFALVSVPVALAFILEKSTGRNVFAVFGGVPAITVVREGKLRAQGAFSHAILAGCFWAIVLSWIAALSLSKRLKLLSVVGVICSLAIVLMCASSTPLLGVAAAVGAGMLFPLRHWLGFLRLGSVALLVSLHFSMKAPVWHLISRIDMVGGSTGYHRYLLIDSAIQNFQDWWLVGMVSTAHWGHQMFDITNQYVLEGVRGGVLTLILFLIGLGFVFRDIGRAQRSTNLKQSELALTWSLGVSLFVHCVCFVAVSYFGQITMLWYLTLACTVSLGQGTVRHSMQQSGPKNSLGATVAVNSSSEAERTGRP